MQGRLVCGALLARVSRWHAPSLPTTLSAPTPATAAAECSCRAVSSQQRASHTSPSAASLPSSAPATRGADITLAPLSHTYGTGSLASPRRWYAAQSPAKRHAAHGTPPQGHSQEQQQQQQQRDQQPQAYPHQQQHQRQSQQRRSRRRFQEHADLVGKLLNSPQPDPQAVLRALRNCASTVDTDSAQALIHHMRRSGVEPTQAHYNAWLAVASPRREGRSILDTMAQRGFSMGEATVQSALQGAVRHRAWSHFDQYLGWVDEYSIKPDHAFYSRLLTLLSDTGNLPPAEFVLQHARARGIAMDAVIFSAMLSLNHEFRRFDRVVELYDAYCKGPLKMTVKTFSAAINALTFSDRVADAERMFADISRCRLPLQVPHYTALMNVYGESGRLGDALKLLHKMECAHRLPDSITFVTLLRACARAGDSGTADRVWAKMTEEYGFVPDEPAWNAYIRAHASDSADMTRARELTLQMRAAGVPMTIFYFNHLLQVFASAGRTQDAEQLVHKAVTLELTPTYDTYLHLMAAYANAGDVPGMRSVFERFKEARLNRNDPRLHTMFLNALAAAGEWEEVLIVTQYMLDAWILFHPDTFVPVLRAFLARGQAGTAFNVLTVDMQRHVAKYDARHLALVAEGLVQATAGRVGGVGAVKGNREGQKGETDEGRGEGNMDDKGQEAEAGADMKGGDGVEGAGSHNGGGGGGEELSDEHTQHVKRLRRVVQLAEEWLSAQGAGNKKKAKEVNSGEVAWKEGQQQGEKLKEEVARLHRVVGETKQVLAA